MKIIISTILSLFVMSMTTTIRQPIIRTEFVKLEFTKIKKSRGKGKGRKPYFAKYF